MVKKHYLTPIQRYIRKIAKAGDAKALVAVYKIAATVDTKVSTGSALAKLFARRGKMKASKEMLRRARLDAADDYNRLLWLNITEWCINNMDENGNVPLFDN